MGVSFRDLRLMWNARQAGAFFERMLTIGRQSLCLHPADVEQLTSCSAEASGHAAELPREHLTFGARAEPFLRASLGAAASKLWIIRIMKGHSTSMT